MGVNPDKDVWTVCASPYPESGPKIFLLHMGDGMDLEILDSPSSIHIHRFMTFVSIFCHS